MNIRITRREVAKQFIIAIELLLDWVEQKENSIDKSTSNDVEEDSLDARLLTAPDIASILNISKGAAYLLTQQKKIPSVHIIRNVHVRQKDLEEFISQNLA
ncbi:MAG: helix-turn-helix domain-containing protein [Chloroflexota bacterium]|nr:MAG: helix-turn-helix domain-containing protein [Chloroflexota bacterium]